MLSTTASILNNTNTPSTDSGYTTSFSDTVNSLTNNNNGNHLSTGLSNAFSCILLVMGLMCLLMHFRNKANKSNSKLSSSK